MLRLSVFLLLVPLLAHAAAPLDLEAARADLNQGRTQRAVATLSQALAQPQDLKAKQRGPAWLLLAQSAAAYGKELERSQSPVRAVRDAWVQGLTAATRASSFPEQAPDAMPLTQSLREALFLQAATLLEGPSPADASAWIDALEGAEGPTVESRTLRGMLSAATGQPKPALAVLAPLTAAADLDTQPVRTPSWGLAYRFQARAVLAQDPGALDAALSVLESGLVWHSRATSDLDAAHDLALRRVRRALTDDRLALLVRVPDRATQALYALESVLADNVGNSALYVQYGPWLEEAFPDRALTLFQDAVATRPDDAALHELLGQHLTRRAAATRAAITTVPRGPEREALQRRLDGEQADGRRHLDRAATLRAGP